MESQRKGSGSQRRATRPTTTTSRMAGWDETAATRTGATIQKR